MVTTKTKLSEALDRMGSHTNEIEVSLTYAEIKEFLLVIELSEVETKLRYEKLRDGMDRRNLIKGENRHAR